MLSEVLGNLRVFFIAFRRMGTGKFSSLFENRVLEGLWLVAHSCLQAKQTINASTTSSLKGGEEKIVRYQDDINLLKNVKILYVHTLDSERRGIRRLAISAP